MMSPQKSRVTEESGFGIARGGVTAVGECVCLHEWMQRRKMESRKRKRDVIGFMAGKE